MATSRTGRGGTDETVGPWELLIIVVVLVALFGADRLPRMARSLGEGIGEFRRAIRQGSDPTAATVSTDPTGQEPGRPTEQQSQQAEQPQVPSR